MSVTVHVDEALLVDDNLKIEVEHKVPDSKEAEASSLEHDEDQFDPLDHGPETALFW